MIFLVLAISGFLFLSVLTAFRPGRRGIFQILAFPVGWAAGELTVQAVILQIVLVGVQWWWGWPSGSDLGDALVLVAVLTICCNLALLGVSFYSRRVVARCMAEAPQAPLFVAPASDDRFGSWWRTLLQIPFHPRRMQLIQDIAYGPFPRHRLDIWRLSTTPQNAPVILFIHGGAWVFGDKREQGRPMLHEFVERGWIAVTPNYRLAPKFAWPAQIEDVTRALGWVKRSIHSMGGDPERIVISGASAGGHLASLLALTTSDPTWRPSELPNDVDLKVRGCISIYGVLEMTGDAEVWDGHGKELRHLLETRVVFQPVLGHEQLYRSLSPYERITPDAPAFLVIQGGNDTLVDVNVARRFVARFREIATAPIYYVEIPLTQHAFEVTASPRTSASTRAAVAFAESVIRPQESAEFPLT